MRLTPGSRLGPYEIGSPLGAGGMGEVYQATDTNLARQVAIKVLPESVAGDPDRLARFDREARTLAALNHPNIAHVYGIENGPPEAGRHGRALVMELVEGPTLADRIVHGALPLEEALPIAHQIAEALEAAHERGIVHRDLKPANVKITPDGHVKVLDFGLAKLVTDDTDSQSRVAVSNSPTITLMATHAGVILGTAAYMAPEQAKGLRVDRRADIFAFGGLLYEMLTGRRAFEGDSTADILSRVLQRDPDWARLPSNVPPSLHRLLRLCLEKDPRKRRQAAGDVRLDLEHALTEPATAPASIAHGRGRLVGLAWAAVALVVIAALALPAVQHLREAAPPEMRLQIVTPPTLDPLDFALSPDGRYLVFVAAGSASHAERIYLRALNETDARPLAGTEGARLPFWSPDSRSLGFFASEQLFRIDIAGGPAQPLAPAANPLGGGAWSATGTIVFAPTTVTPLFQVPASGGTLTAATELEPPGQTNHRRPFFLPRSPQFLLLAAGPGQSDIYLASLDGGRPKRLSPADSGAEVLGSDHIVFAQQGALVARRFNATRAEVIGDPVRIVDAGSAGQGAAIGFSVSAAGRLAYRVARAAPPRMTWFDRSGTVLGEGADLNAPNLSPDGRYVAYDRTIAGNRDVWIMDLVRGGTTRFTNDAAIDGYPVWSPDGTRLVFHSLRKGTFDIWTRRSDGATGTEELLLETPDHEWPIAWSKDGRYLLYQRTDRNYESSDLLALPMTGNSRTPVVVADTPAEERMGEFSPDGRWIAYQTSESGKPEIVVRGFPESKAIVHVSTAGGTGPRWRADGTEIYFVAPDGKMMAVGVTTTGDTITLGKPVPLFSTHIVSQVFTYQYAVASDGRFLVYNRQLADAPPITLLLNWKP